jgi:hypothetical protein
MARFLGTVAAEDGTVPPATGWTDIFIRPQYRFRAVDHLVTNFHLPKSTLMLVSPFCDYDLAMESYREALAERYRVLLVGRRDASGVTIDVEHAAPLFRETKVVGLLTGRESEREMSVGSLTEQSRFVDPPTGFSRMTTLVGVKETTVHPLSKRDFLLFDKILVPELDVDLATASDPAVRADLKWLESNGMIEDASPINAMRHVRESDPVTPAIFSLTSLLVSDSAALAALSGANPVGFKNLAQLSLLEIAPRMIAAHYQDTNGIRSIPLHERASRLAQRDVYQGISEHLPAIEKFLERVRAGSARFTLYPGVERFGERFAQERLLAGYVDDFEILARAELMPGVIPSPVLDVVVEALPMPDESVPWQQIREFTLDPDTRLQLLELRAWMRKVAAASIPAHERHYVPASSSICEFIG